MSRRFRATTILGAILAVAPFATLPGLAGPAQAAPILKATFTQPSVWDSGYGGDYTIANSGDTATSSWVVKGIGYTIEDNTGTFTSPGTFAHGYETHNPSTTPSFMNGCGNVWRNNRSDLGGMAATPSTSRPPRSARAT